MVEQQISQVMAQVFEVPVELISESCSPENLAEWTSLRHMELIVELEKKFNIFISEEESIRLMSFKAIHKLILKKLNSI